MEDEKRIIREYEAKKRKIREFKIAKEMLKYYKIAVDMPNNLFILCKYKDERIVQDGIEIDKHDKDEIVFNKIFRVVRDLDDYSISLLIESL